MDPNRGCLKGINGVVVVTRVLTQSLFELDDDDLFAAARKAASMHAGTMQAAPIILTGDCRTRPLCRHCKWEHFKAAAFDSFALDHPLSDLIARAHRLADRGITRAFAATGWMGYSLPRNYIDAVYEIRSAEPRLELFGLFGALDQRSHKELAFAGLSGMLTSLESPSKDIYRSFRPGGDSLDDRMRALDFATESGLKVWTGFLVGLGESIADVAAGIEALSSFEPESISILPFVPFPDTPMANHPPTDPLWLARVNAVARIQLPETRFFFSDHDQEFDRIYADRIGINGSYETGIG